MRLKKFCRFAVILFALPIADTGAFEINPNNHQPAAIKSNLKAEYKRFLSHLSHPTHEVLTDLSLQCAQAQIHQEWCDLDSSVPQTTRGVDAEALRFGAQWNDDPNNYFRVNQEAHWFYCIKAASVAHKLPMGITVHHPLEYRSHYGDLQFLHGMGSVGQDPALIRDQILAWAQFTYDVAIGKISPSTQLFSLEKSYPFVRNFSETGKRRWTVEKLFSNQGAVGSIKCIDGGEQQVPHNDKQIPDVALGALLHTLQDSYSHSHVQRSETGIHAWLDYGQQDSECHGHADEDIGWIEDEKIKTKPAIKWGAWLIRQAMQRVGWEEGVRTTLANQVFALDEGSPAPYDGGYKIGGSACPAATAAPSEVG